MLCFAVASDRTPVQIPHFGLARGAGAQAGGRLRARPLPAGRRDGSRAFAVCAREGLSSCHLTLGHLPEPLSFWNESAAPLPDADACRDISAPNEFSLLVFWGGGHDQWGQGASQPMPIKSCGLGLPVAVGIGSPVPVAEPRAGPGSRRGLSWGLSCPALPEA